MANPDLVKALLGGAETWNKGVRSDTNVLDFREADLSKLDSLQGYHFGKPVSFAGARFQLLRFPDSAFQGGADFTGATIVGEAYIVSSGDRRERLTLEKMVFHGRVTVLGGAQEISFDGSKFLAGLRFSAGGPFRGRVSCKYAEVNDSLHADGVEFRGKLKLEGLKLSGEGRPALSFSKTQFGRGADFRGMTIAGTADFDGAIFANSTSFKGTVFQIAPSFHKSQLHAETVFDPVDSFDVQFPDISSEFSEKRYQTLKNLMIGQQALSEQLGFARLEMKAHAARLPFRQRVIHRLYGLFGDYGLSSVRPTLWLVTLALWGWLILWVIHHPTGSPSERLAVAGLAISNALPFVPIAKFVGTLTLDDLFPGDLAVVVTIVAALQTTLSTVLLFLIGLGVRNRLRMK